MEKQEQTTTDTEPEVVQSTEETATPEPVEEPKVETTADSSVSVTKDPDNVRTNILNRWPDESEKTDDLKAKLKGRD